MPFKMCLRFFATLVGMILMLCVSGCQDTGSSADVAARHGILLMGNNSEPQSLDPHLATAVSDGRIISTLLEGLVRPDSEDITKVHPAVAESWSHDENAQVWCFTLRESARWSDGRAVLAADFVYAFQRLLHPEFAGKYAQMLYPIKGAQQYNQGNLEWDCVGVKALSDRELEIQLVGPTPHLLELLLHYTWFPIPSHSVEKHGGMLDRKNTWTRPENWIGNGAYILKEHRFNHYLEVSASPQYWRHAEVKNKGVRFLPIVNGFTETRMFFDGKLHITNNVPPEMISYARQRGGEQFVQSPYYSSVFYRLNTNRRPLNDVRVRRALSLAIDREALVNRVVRGAGEVSMSFTPLSVGFAPTPPSLPAAQEQREQLARDLLKEAGYSGGQGFPTIELMTSSREVQRIMAETIQAFWKQVLGVQAEIRVYEWTAYKAAQQNGDYEVSSSSWSGDFLDPSNFVELWRSNGGNNNTGWSSQAYDDELLAAQRSISRDERMTHLERAESLMLEQQPIIPLYWGHRTYLVSPHVRGFYPCLLEMQPLDAIELVSDEKEVQR